MANYFAGGELGDFIVENGGLGSGAVRISTNGATFRTPYARCSVWVGGQGRIVAPFGAQTSGAFWVGLRVWQSYDYGDPPSDIFTLRDSSGVTRLVFHNTGSGADAGLQVYTQDATGSRTLLFTTTIGIPANSSFGPTKVDIKVDPTGGVWYYIDGAPAGSYSGNIETDGVSQYAFLTMACWTAWGPPLPNYYSEVVVDSQDTRPMLGLQYMNPASNGASTDFGGSASNVGTDAPNLAAPDFSDTNGDLQQYGVGNYPTGPVVVRSVVVSVQAIEGPGSAVANLALNVNFGGTDYTGSGKALPAYWGPLQDSFGPNEPNVVALNTAGMAALQIGYKAET